MKMSTMKRACFAASLAFLLPVGHTAAAQGAQGGGAGASQGDGAGAGLETDLKPGLHVRADSSDGSLLSQAARDRASIVIGENEQAQDNSAEPVQIDTYSVKDGDTLWDICAARFGDPYVWPRIWSYNPKITNPHWIYPGDVLWLTPPRAVAQAPASVAPDAAPAPTAPRRGGEVMIRNRGFVDKEILRRSGTVVGSQKEISMLSELDEAYVEFKENREIAPGEEYTVFEALRDVDSVEDPGSEMGKLVEILGSARVTSFDKEKGIARVVIDESLQPIERGAMVGPVNRKYQVVATVPNDRELKGHIVAFLDPIVMAAAHQIAFVDRGVRQGVREGNRFFVIEKRDTYRESLGEDDDRDGYPFEVLAELRVVEARPNTSTCLVTAAVRELEVGAEVEMVKGY
jgi:hypothetical protein